MIFNDKKNKACAMAESLGKNMYSNDEKRINEKLSGMNRGALKQVWEKVLRMWQVFNSPETPVHIKALICGSFLYLLMPIDIIPDFIPIAGLLDDVAVVAVLFAKLVTLGFLADGTGIAVNKGIKYFTDIHRKNLRKVLWSDFKKTAIITIVNLLITVSGCLLLYFFPMKSVAPYAALVLFCISLLLGIIRLVLLVCRTYKPVVYIVHARSVRTGLANYCRDTQPWLKVAERSIIFCKDCVPSFTQIPDLEKIVDEYVLFLRKDLLLMAGIFVVYGIVLFVVLRVLVPIQIGFPLTVLYTMPFLHSITGSM